MSAALTRYANPAAEIGHAGPTAPIHADERIALADLPAFPQVSEVEAQSFRAKLLRRDADQLRRTNRMLREALAETLKIASRAARTPTDDEVIERATRVMTLGGML